MNKIVTSLLVVLLTAATLLFISSARSDVASEAIEVPPPVNLPVPTITLPPKIIRVTKTVQVPGPTKTVEIPLPQATVTRRIPVPGPTQTVTVTEGGRVIREPGSPAPRSPRATKTVTVPGPTQTVTRQADPRRVILPPREKEVPVPFVETVIKSVGLGLLAIAGIMGLIILGLWLGYALGFKDREKSEKDFLEALKAQALGRGKHE